MGKLYRAQNTWDALQDRLQYIFSEFDNVLVAFSCGKDSGVVLNAAYDYAKRTGQMHKLAYYYQDYEANYQDTHDFAERTFAALNECRRYWLCLPFSAACAVSMHQTRWIPWNPDERGIWVRDMPKGEYVISMDNCPFPFEKGTKGFDTRIIFSQWFGSQFGRTAVLVGIRADESLSRLGIITSQHRKHMHNGCRYSKIVDSNTVNFYPIYDWATQDIWVANARQGWDYNNVYDLYHMAGLSIHEMRVASPFHHAGQGNLHLYRTLDPTSWGKMVSRVNGVNFCSIYGGTTAMGWKDITKPAHFTWKQYAEFLLATLPENVRNRFLFHLGRLKISWSEDGYGRNPDVIRIMEEEGIPLEKTGRIDKRCTKPGVYEIVKIKGEFPDETKSGDFRHCPNWKAVCITIMKNDFTLQYMGCGRTKSDMDKRRAALAKYANL